MNKIRKDNNGFTLVEIVVVVVILVVLISIMIPTFSKYFSNDYQQKLRDEAQSVLDSAQVKFYDLYAENSHGSTNDGIISGDNDLGSDAKKYPKTYRIKQDANNIAKDCDFHWNPLASEILQLAGLDIKSNYPSIVFVVTGRYDVYADPNSKLYDPEKAYTVYLVGYQPYDNGDFVFLGCNGKQSNIRDELIYKKKDPIYTDRTKQSFMDIGGEEIRVQYYMLKGSRRNDYFIDKIWTQVNNSGK